MADDADDLHLTNTFTVLGTVVAASVQRVAHDIGLRPAEAATMNLVTTSLRGASVDQLSRALDLTHSGAVRVVDRLSARGLATRRSDPDDARAVRVQATAKGRKLAQELRATQHARVHSVLQSLTTKERATLAVVVDKLLADTVQPDTNPFHMCRWCDPTACGHHRGACPVTEAMRSGPSEAGPTSG